MKAPAATPLISLTKEVTNNNTSNRNKSSGHDLQFYDVHAVTNISREVAFGYLILLTGGYFEYKAPTLTPTDIEDGHNQQTQQHEENRDKRAASISDEETYQLAYSAIVDGNVLHAVFGLKATADGKASIIDEKPKSSIFCCLPSSSTLDALNFILPQSAKNKLKVQQLVEALQEVRELYYESMVVPNDAPTTFSLHIDVIQGYVTCFTAIVRYHDQKSLLERSSSKESTRLIDCCPSIIENLFCFNQEKKRKKKNQELEELKNETLNEIESGFNGLREKILEHSCVNAALSVTSG
jgi:hypothetical protein